MRPIGKKIAICAAVTVAGLGLTSCGNGDDSKSKVDSISDTVNDAVKLEGELYQAVNRLIVDCLEEQDFDIHPKWMTEDYSDGEEEEWDPLDDSETPDSYDVPTLKDAKKEGFGRNDYLDPDYDESEDMEEMESEGEDPFYEESEEYQKAYEKAQYGEEYYKWMYDDSDTEFTDDEEGGEADVMDSPPLEGGCSGEVSKKVYGEPITPDPKDEDAESSEPYYGVEYPSVIDDWDKQQEMYETDKLLDARDALSKCIEAEGYPYFEYVKHWGMGMSSYVDGFYKDNEGMMMGDEETDGPPEYDLPKGAPWKDYDEAFAAEVAFATTVATCADDTGFRKVSKKAWKDAIEKSVLDGEKEIYAWYDDLKAALDKAQDLIGK